MYIHEAIKEAGGRRIARKSWKALWGEELDILPGDSPDCCLLFGPHNRDTGYPRWNPEKGDLVADDWYVKAAP